MQSNNLSENNSVNRVKGRLFNTLRSQMIFSFGFLFVFVMVSFILLKIYGVPFTTIEGEYQYWQSEVFKNINMVADLKKERLQRWLEERRDDARAIAKSELILMSINGILEIIEDYKTYGQEDDELWKNVQREKVYQVLIHHLNTINHEYGIYEKIVIANAASGVIIVSTEPGNLGLNISTSKIFRHTLNSVDVVMLHGKDPIGDDIDLMVSKIIKPGNFHNPGKYTGNVILTVFVNTNDFIGPIIQTGPGLGQTGEALLVDEEVRIFAPLKHPLADGTIAEPMEYRINAKPALFAVSGEEGIIAADDYRGVPVLAAYRYIPVNTNLGWGLVVKRDREEVFAMLRKDIINSLWFGLFGIVFVIGIVLIIAGKLSRPIKHLSRVARNVEGGNLNARVSVIPSGELGNLSLSFNSMIRKLQNWYDELDKQVELRTKELSEVNKNLQILRGELEQKILERTEELEDKVQKLNKSHKAMLFMVEDLNRTSKKLKTTQEELISKERLAVLGQFSGSISHELRNSLGVIDSSIYYLNMKLKDKEKKVEQHLRRISSSVNIATNIIQSLLSLTRMKKPELSKRDLLKILSEIIRSSKLPATIEVVKHFPEEEVVVLIEKEQCRMAFKNIIKNASEAMEGKGTLKVSVKKRNGFAEISFNDSGTGIEQENLQKIFQPLYSTKTNGIGFGLSITKMIVENHGGAVKVRSKPGKGANFIVSVQLADLI